MSTTINRTSDHIRAFALSFSVIWGATPFASEVNNLAYFRALTSFMGSEADDLADRRKLMYAYLQNDFASDNQEDTINQLYNIIPIEESISRIMRNLCGLYTQAPNRKFEIPNPKIEEAYKTASINDAFKIAHRTAKLCNTVLVMPTVRDGKIEIDILPPDLFRFTTDPKDYRKITELWIPINSPDAAGNPRYTFKVWSQDSFCTLDSEGRETSYEKNKYGIIPACVLQFNSSRTDYYGGGLWDLLSAVLDDNKLCFLANNDVVYTAFSVWIATNFGKENIKIAPNRLLKVDKVTAGEGFEIAPSLQSISGNAAFMEIEQLRDVRYKKALRKMGLPESLISANPGLAPSGVAMQIDRQELMEIRSEDAEIFRKFENDFYPIFAKIINTDLGSGLPDICAIGIDYVEPQQYIEPATEQASKQLQFDFGIIGAKDFVNYFVKNELITTDEEAINYLIKNRELRNKLITYEQSISNYTPPTGAGKDSTNGGGEPSAEGKAKQSREAISPGQQSLF